jgi:protein-tyrosine phosphatase
MAGFCEIVPIASNALWCCCDLKENQPLQDHEIDSILDAIRKTPAFQTTLARVYRTNDDQAMSHDVKYALQHPLRKPPDLASLQRVMVVMPETWEEYCCCDWDGSGQFNMSRYVKSGLPTLLQLVEYIRMMEAACEDNSQFVIHLSSKNCRRTGAVLNGGLKVLLDGMLAEEVWGELQLASPAPSEDPALAWDRFGAPFAVTRKTSAASLQVKDCLLGLQFARDLGWITLGTFDRHEWDFLRRKFDLTWVIPDEIAAMGHPYTTAQNPTYPALLDPLESSTEHVLSKQVDGKRSRLDSTPSTTSTYSQLSSLSPSPSVNCLSEWDFEDSDVAEEGDINSVRQEINFSIHGLDDDDDIEDAAYPEDRLRSSSTVIDLDSAYDTIVTSCYAPTFASYFQRASISNICRLNLGHECMEQDSYFSVLRDMGMSLHQCAFTDGSVPSRSIVQSFLELCRDGRKRGNQRMAVHCMAGLGRTGTLIATYAVAHYGIPGNAWHGWVRMCRPGSIQTECQEAFVRRLMPKSRSISSPTNKSPTHAERLGNLMKKVSSWGSNLSSAR